MDIHSSAQNEDIWDLASMKHDGDAMVVNGGTRGTLTSPEHDSNFLEVVWSIPQAIHSHILTTYLVGIRLRHTYEIF